MKSFVNLGNITDFENLFKNGNIPYSITMEIGKIGKYETSLHIASHFGKLEVLDLLIKLLDSNPNSFEITTQKAAKIIS